MNGGKGGGMKKIAQMNWKMGIDFFNKCLQFFMSIKSPVGPVHSKHQWSSGMMNRCHRFDRGSIPR